MEGARRGGFSLLEMLAVLCIVGLLASLLVPAAGAARNALLRQRSQWQFREILSALDAYELHYGHRPPFLREEETPIALAPLCQDLIDALQGRNGATPAPSNPDNLRFGSLDPSWLAGHPTDAFGNGELYLILRREGLFAIPQKSFPESIRDAVPAGGVAEAHALWSVGDRPARRGVSWL
ncbi:MAG: type II secretion system GspH family protein [Puniceicoccales bacterium]|jgi:prepilin-type N-terminal cleavage/methylation domain-containing protein|nr:type II secretion system GspH family protein [Puniceicoccales bacterium]